MRTRRADPAGPGLGRIRRGRGFSYCDEGGTTITDEAVLERIKALVIPPAWKEVWICADERGHIQAVGIDAAGRRQYLYHDAWRAQRDRQKFKRLPEFAEALGPVREALEAELNLKGLVRERVMACAVRLLDVGFFRVGGEDYAADNESYGLATFEKRHVRIRKGALVFDYIAKGGIEQEQTVQDRVVMPTVAALKRRRGKPTDPLLAFRARRGEWHDVSSDDVNQHLKDLVGEDFTAKDFRTWNATVIAAMLLADREDADDKAKAVTEVIGTVANILGNTPAVCRASYVDPRVIAKYERGETIRRALDRITPKNGDDFADRGATERAVIKLIK